MEHNTALLPQNFVVYASANSLFARLCLFRQCTLIALEQENKYKFLRNPRLLIYNSIAFVKPAVSWGPFIVVEIHSLLIYYDSIHGCVSKSNCLSDSKNVDILSKLIGSICLDYLLESQCNQPEFSRSRFEGRLHSWVANRIVSDLHHLSLTLSITVNILGLSKLIEVNRS